MSSAVVHGGLAYLKGVTPTLQSDDIADQTEDVLQQVSDLLNECGSGRDKIIKVMIWLADIADFEAMNAVYDDWLIKGCEPVRACVEARLASPHLKVEIQVTAFL